MASSSSSTGGSPGSSTKNRTYRSFFIDDEADESGVSEESESESTIDDRLRQKQASVPLRKRGQRNVYETVVARLEADVQEELAQGERRQAMSRKVRPGPPSPSPPPSTSTSPHVDDLSQFEELTVDTCSGPVTILLPLVPNEDELSRETRIFELEEEVLRARERQEIERLAGRIRKANPDRVPRAPASDTPASPSLVPPVPVLTSLPCLDIPVIPVATDVEMLLPEADADASLSKLQPVVEGWKLVKQFLQDQISFVQAETEFNRLFGSAFDHSIWSKIQYINDLDPDELQSQQLSLTREVDTHIQTCIDCAQPMPPLPAKNVAENDQVNEDNEEIRFRLFRVRCFRSFEADAFTKIYDDIVAHRIDPLILRAVYKALQPGYLYIEAQSMLAKNTRLAGYLLTVPGLVYMSSPKISFPNEQAWSRKHEKVKKTRPPTWSAPEATMPIYQTVIDVGFHPETEVKTGLPPGSWVIPSKGRYKGDMGLVVEDDYDTVDTSISALVIFIPRVKFPNAPSSKRPPKSTLPVDFRKPPTEWSNFDYVSKLQAWCINGDCLDPLQCQHQTYLEKRYQLFQQVIRGGFALVVCNVSELRLVTRMPARLLATFTELPMPENLWSNLHIRLPPPDSWSFLEGDQVYFTRRFGETGKFLTRCDLADLPVGVVGTILKVNQYVCDVDLDTWGHRSIPWYNLVKTIGVGRSIKISDGVGSAQELRRIELGESSLACVTATRTTLAGRDGIVTHRYEVAPYGETLDIWVQDLELVITLDPNSVLDHTDNTVYSRHFTASAPRLVFDEFSAVQRQEVHQRPSLSYHKWDSTARYDLRNASSVTESAWLLQNNSRPNYLHPAQYYALGRFRPPGRLPWFGVQVTVDLGDRMVSGEVQDVIPKVDDMSEFQVLVTSYDNTGNAHSSWFDYQTVRRQDNQGRLHEFSTYTGQVPWQGLQVRVIHGPLRDRGIGVVKDVSVDSRSTSISGLLLDIEFESGYVVGERRQARVDYDSVRKLDNRFIHDGWVSKMPKNGYFQLKMGYSPKYSEHALQLLSRPISGPSETISSLQPSPPPSSPASPYFRFADLRWKNAFQEDFWLLDRRIARALGPREIYIWSAAQANDVRISFHETSTGLELRYVKDHKGGRKTADVIDPRSLSTTPMSLKLKGSTTANGLYLICQGEHAGKLTRRVNYIQAYPPDQDQDIWVLQVVRCVWRRARILDHEESIVAQERLLRLRKGILALVHEADRERAQANAMMATLRLQQGGSAPEYTLVDGEAQKIQR